MSLMNPFSKVAAALGISLLVSGCASTITVQGGPCTEGGGGTFLGTGGYSMRYNNTCGVRQAAGDMIKSDDVGIRATGMAVLEETSPVIEGKADKVRDALVNPGEQTATVVKGQDGKFRIILDGAPPTVVPVRPNQVPVKGAPSGPTP